MLISGRQRLRLVAMEATASGKSRHHPSGRLGGTTVCSELVWSNSVWCFVYQWPKWTNQWCMWIFCTLQRERKVGNEGQKSLRDFECERWQNRRVTEASWQPVEGTEWSHPCVRSSAKNTLAPFCAFFDSLFDTVAVAVLIANSDALL